MKNLKTSDWQLIYDGLWLSHCAEDALEHDPNGEPDQETLENLVSLMAIVGDIPGVEAEPPTGHA